MNIDSFKIATFNANGLRARIPIIKKWLLENPVDCLCIQETKVRDEDFPKEEFESLGLNVVFRGQKAYNGVAIISPHAIKNALFGFGDGNEEEEVRQIVCSINGITIINSYVPQGRALDHPAFQKKLKWFSDMIKLFDSLEEGTPFIWCGDMNVAPEPIDVYAPEKKKNHVCFHESVRDAFKNCISWGLFDCFRKLHPNEPDRYTFYDYRIPKAVERRLGWRIDHILAPKGLKDSLVECEIDIRPRLMKRPSDHTFLFARFDLKRPSHG